MQGVGCKVQDVGTLHRSTSPPPPGLIKPGVGHLGRLSRLRERERARERARERESEGGRGQSETERESESERERLDIAARAPFVVLLLRGDLLGVMCRANMAHIRQSRPDSNLGFQVRVLTIFLVVPFSLGSGSWATAVG